MKRCREMPKVKWRAELDASTLLVTVQVMGCKEGGPKPAAVSQVCVRLLLAGRKAIVQTLQAVGRVQGWPAKKGNRWFL